MLSGDGWENDRLCGHHSPGCACIVRNSGIGGAACSVMIASETTISSTVMLVAKATGRNGDAASTQNTCPATAVTVIGMVFPLVLILHEAMWN